MDPNDVPSQSSLHSSRAYFDPTNIMGQTPLLHSPPLAHEHARYGLPQMPSAFSVIGRRPGYPAVPSHHDFNTSLSHDPMMVSTANPTTTTSWWRPTPNTQGMANTDLFGNPLVWLPHDQEHMHPHDSLSYHNPQTFRNFDILNGSSSSSFYAPAPRFFPDASAHIPTLNKERPLSWEERLSHSHGLMMDSSNTFSPWQDIHSQKSLIEKQRRPSIDGSGEKRNTTITNNRASSFEDSLIFKSLKQPDKYIENQQNTPSSMMSSTGNTERRTQDRQSIGTMEPRALERTGIEPRSHERQTVTNINEQRLHERQSIGNIEPNPLIRSNVNIGNIESRTLERQGVGNVESRAQERQSVTDRETRLPKPHVISNIEPRSNERNSGLNLIQSRSPDRQNITNIESRQHERQNVSNTESRTQEPRMPERSVIDARIHEQFNNDVRTNAKQSMQSIMYGRPSMDMRQGITMDPRHLDRSTVDHRTHERMILDHKPHESKNLNIDQRSHENFVPSLGSPLQERPASVNLEQRTNIANTELRLHERSVMDVRAKEKQKAEARSHNMQEVGPQVPAGTGLGAMLHEKTTNIKSRPNERTSTESHPFGMTSPKFIHHETSKPIEHIQRTQAQSAIQNVPTTAHNKKVTWSMESNLNMVQPKRDSVINTPEIIPAPEVSVPSFSKPLITQSTIKPSVITSPTSVSKQSVIGGQPVVLRQPGGKPPLLERFRASMPVKNNESSSDEDGSSEEADGDEEDDEESGSETNSEEEMSIEEEKTKYITGSVAIQNADDATSESDVESVGQGSDDDDDDDEDSNDGTQDSDYSLQGTSPGKRKNALDTGSQRKRRIVVLNETLMKIPLEKGWKRQTRLRPAPSGAGLRGDVFYFAPCGKKLRTYPDVEKYIDKNGITDLDLSHFSFSMKLYIGEFLEATQGTEFRTLSEDEVQQRKIAQDEKQRVKMEKLNRRKEKRMEQEENAKKIAEAKINRKLQRQAAIEAAKQAKLRKAQERLQQKLEKQEMLQAAKQAKRERARQLAEQKKRSKEEEKMQKIEKQKMEKEVKAQQIIEAKKRKREDVANARYCESMKKAQERELRRQQAVLLKAQEKERIKEQKKQAKKMIRERKLEQKRREMILTRELKKPVEDMVLRDAKPLPELTRLKDLRLSGSAFADLLMTQEFLHNFGQALDIDFDTEVPSMSDMQASLLNESDDDYITPVCQMLLLAALDDPGVIGPQSETSLGVKLEQIELNEHNISEVLRLFILARNAEPNEVSDALIDKPFTALSPTHKASSLAFICNELLCGRTICREIENNIENMSTLRHNKWIVEGNLRKLKAVQQKKFPEKKANNEKKSPGRKPNVSQNGETRQAKNKKSVVDEEEDEEEDEEDEDEEDEDDDDEDEDDDEDDDNGGDGGDEDEDDEEESEDENKEPETAEEFAKQIKKLEKKQGQFRFKLFSASHSLRALFLGQDRFRRLYWALPYGGSVFIEGKDTGECGLEECLDPQRRPDDLRDMKILGESFSQQPKTIISPNFLHLGVNRMFGDTLEKREAKDDLSTFKLNRPNGQNVGIGDNKTSDACPMKLLMQQVSSQSNTANFGTQIKSPTDMKCNNHQPTTMKNGHHSDIIRSPVLDTPWFSLVPRQPCDSTTVINCWMPKVSSRKSIDGTPPRKPGRPPKIPRPPDLADNTRPNVTDKQSPEKSNYNFPVIPRPLTLDEVRQSVMESLRQDPAPIPEEMHSGWWRITDARLLKDLTKTLHQRGIREKMLHKNILKYHDYTQHSCEKQHYQLSVESSSEDENEEQTTTEEKTSSEIIDDWFPDQAFAANKNVLIEVEDLEEKIFAASLQIKGWRLPPQASKTLSYSVKTDGSKPESVCGLPLTIAITRLAALEDGIERRYLKSPLRNEKLNIPSNINSSGAITEEKKDDTENKQEATAIIEKEVITPALKLWRETVSSCRTPSQLYMCLTLLNDCIAWDKSIMKVFCQMCRKGDNEELLLLCDGCDRGYHTYCCQPKMDTIPVGDWYCTDCIIMATGKSCCFVCRGTTERLLRCTQCPRNYHQFCLDPPLSKVPRLWSCPNCKKVKSKTRSRASTTRRKKKKQIEENEADDKTSNSATDDSRPHLNRKQSSKDLAPCRSLLAEMEKHEDAWPFLVPVNGKQFPEYYKIIPCPMDFHTMKVKLRDFQYPCREEFAMDTRLIFDNCNHFNEDDSEVGQAGKRLRKYFEKRWVEINRDLDDP